MSLIQSSTGFGLVAAITSLGNTQAVAINIAPNNQTARHLTVMASIYAQPATADDLQACFSRLIAWAGDEPTDAVTTLLDPLSAYYGQLPGRPVIDVMVPAMRPFYKELSFVVQPQDQLWFYLGLCRHAITLAAVQGHISLAVINRDNSQNDTQGLKPV